MKKYLKGILASVLVLTFVLGLGACGKKDDATETTSAQTTTVAQTEAPAKISYVGTWKVISVEAQGVTVNDPASMGLDMTFEFKEGGVVDVTASGEKDTEKWEEKDGGIEIVDEEGITVKGEMDDDKLVLSMSQDGMDMKFILEKQ